MNSMLGSARVSEEGVSNARPVDAVACGSYVWTSLEDEA